MSDKELDALLSSQQWTIDGKPCGECGAVKSVNVPAVEAMTSDELRDCISSNENTDTVGASWVRICRAELERRATLEK